MRYIPAENRFLVRAGVGWQEGIVGVATVGADLESPSGFALRTGKPVISNHLENEQRFRTPELLLEHGIRRAMNVILQGDGSPYGVLEVDSRSEGEFGEHDIAFLQGAANILGMAIERQRYERHLKAALDRHQVLLKEISHRVKNSLQIVSSMLHLQASTADDDGLIASSSPKHPVVSPPLAAHTSGWPMMRTSRTSILALTCRRYVRTRLAPVPTASFTSTVYLEFGSPPIELFLWL